MARLKLAAALLTGALAATCWWGWLMLDHADQDAQALAEARERGRQEAMEPILDRPVPDGCWMPMWLQTDPQWANVPYAGSTIGEAGCGLVCASMAIEYMTLQSVTPAMLADAVGDSCLTDGVNDPGKFCEWIASHYPEYGIEYSPITYELDPVLASVGEGWLAFGGMSGALGDSSYGGHVVLIWRSEDGSYWVRDPASGENSQRAWSRDELAAVDWKYFYTIRGGLYGR